MFILSRKYLPMDSKKITDKKHLDWLGFSLFAITMILLFTAISEGEFVGYGNLFIISAFIATIIFFVSFIIREKKAKMPMLDLNLFKNKLFSLSIFCAFISFFVISSSTLILPYYLQDLRVLSPFWCGIIMLASPLVMMLVAPLSGSASDKFGSEILTFIGLIIVSISLSLMALLYNQNIIIFVVPLIIGIMAIGNAMFQSPNTSLIMSTVPRDELGIAGSINGLVRNAGMVCGVAVSSVLLWSIMSRKIGYKVLTFIPEQPDAFVHALRGVFIIEAIICMIGVVLTGIRIWSRKSKKEQIIE